MKKWAVIVFLVAAVSGHAATYTLLNLGQLDDAIVGFNSFFTNYASDATINAINVNGKMVGITASNNVAYNGFIYTGARTNLGTLGGAYSEAQGINNSNVICGFALTPAGYTNAFRWIPGATNGVTNNPQMINLGTLGGLESYAYDINLSGQIAGTAKDAAGTLNACRFNTDGTITNLGIVINGSATDSIGWAINQNGSIAGETYDPINYSPQAFIWNNNDNSINLLGDLTGGGGGGGFGNVIKSRPYAINNLGQAVGEASINNNFDMHAFRWRPVVNKMFDLGTLGGTSSSAWSINSSNIIVGKAALAGDLAEHAFIATNDTMTDLNAQLDASSNSWVLIKAEYINDAGQIVGYGTNNGTLHGFLLTQIPFITNQPASTSVAAGSNATFTVGAIGNTNLTYQWRFNGTNILGATASFYTRTNAQTTNAGSYSVVITNGFGAVTSSVAALSIIAPPVISLKISGTNALVSFLTATGATYFLDGKTNLVSGNWTNLVGNIAGTGATNTSTNFGISSTKTKFYRVRVTVP